MHCSHALDTVPIINQNPPARARSGNDFFVFIYLNLVSKMQEAVELSDYPMNCCDQYYRDRLIKQYGRSFRLTSYIPTSQIQKRSGLGFNIRRKGFKATTNVHVFQEFDDYVWLECCFHECKSTISGPTLYEISVPDGVADEIVMITPCYWRTQRYALLAEAERKILDTARIDFDQEYVLTNNELTQVALDCPPQFREIIISKGLSHFQIGLLVEECTQDPKGMLASFRMLCAFGLIEPEYFDVLDESNVIELSFSWLQLIASVYEFGGGFPTGDCEHSVEKPYKRQRLTFIKTLIECGHRFSRQNRNWILRNFPNEAPGLVMAMSSANFIDE